MPIINLDDIYKKAERSIRRSGIFLGIGVNTANKPGEADYLLSRDESMIHFLPAIDGEEAHNHIKEAFRTWVISCGLRELIEGLGAVLDLIFDLCLYCRVYHTKEETHDQAQRKLNRFKRLGLEKKLNQLNKDFGISSEKSKYLHSINQARNCITHRGSIVGREDCNDDEDFLRLIWWKLQVYAEAKSGKKILLEPPFPEGGILLEEESAIMLEVTEKELIFKIGEPIKISSSDLYEICLLTHFFSKELLQSAADFIRSLGIKEAKAK